MERLRELAKAPGLSFEEAVKGSIQQVRRFTLEGEFRDDAIYEEE